MESKPTSLKAGGNHFLRFANVDERLIVWVDRSLPFGDSVAYPAPQESGPFANDLQPASVGVSGIALSVHHLKLCATPITRSVRAAAIARWPPMTGATRRNGSRCGTYRWRPSMFSPATICAWAITVPKVPTVGCGDWCRIGCCWDGRWWFIIRSGASGRLSERFRALVPERFNDDDTSVGGHVEILRLFAACGKNEKSPRHAAGFARREASAQRMETAKPCQRYWVATRSAIRCSPNAPANTHAGWYEAR